MRPYKWTYTAKKLLVTRAFFCFLSDVFVYFPYLFIRLERLACCGNDLENNTLQHQTC